MKKKFLFIALVLLVFAVLINYLIIKPRSIDFETQQLNGKFSGFIAYKNNQRGFYLYLVNDLSVVKRLKLDTLYEGVAFNKPQIGNDIRHIVLTDSSLYHASYIEDKIEKLSNSNKCFLITKDSIFRFNCYTISESKRKNLGKINEWASNEIGFWKKTISRR